MAVTESKRSSARTQPATRKSSTPESLRFTEKRKGKTTIRQYRGRSFHRFEEAKGKPIDYIEFFTCGGFHSIDISFQDKTAVHFVIEPTFNLETEFADWKTGNWRGIKEWPLIRSATLSA